MKSGSLSRVKNSAGFTLLEMMLTVGLIALTATFVGINVGQSNAQLADLEARRFLALLNLAQDESIMSGRPISLTIDTAARQYSFAPLGVPSVFLPSGSDSEGGDTEDGAIGFDKEDDIFKARNFPEALTIEYSRLPTSVSKQIDDGFVPRRVKEIFEKDLFDRDDIVRDDPDSENTLLIEPNGLITPFSLSLSVDGRLAKVELDRFGKAVLVKER
jgi:prepilin-type N-terminal cleavage/methylation domain-containing protein